MSIRAESTFSLKDELFNASTLGLLTANVAAAYPRFQRKAFERQVLSRFGELELKARIACMAQTLNEFLPDNPAEAREILLQALPEPLDPNLQDNDFGQFIWVVPGEAVALSHCNPQQFKAGLKFLRESTKRFSAEFAIRPFLLHFPEQSMAFVHQAAEDNNYHVRRLASEGIRPFLPWAPRVNLPPDQIVGVLDKLHADTTRYVTRSVANTLNDLSKGHPTLVMQALQRWQRQGRQQPDELDWMTRHSLRTLLKSGDSSALTLTGYPAKPRFTVDQVQVSERVALGQSLVWRGVLHSQQRQKLKIALRVHFLKANGRHSIKVFALKELQLDADSQIELVKQLTFKPLTTRVLYPGKHRVELSVNGQICEAREFELTAG
ncbi:MAG: DNA alkylation repair protein [bacterium]